MWNKLTKEQKLNYLNISTKLNWSILILDILWFIFIILTFVWIGEENAAYVAFTALTVIVSLALFAIEITAIIFASYTRGMAGDGSMQEALFAFTLVAFLLLPIIMTILAIIWCYRLTKVAKEEQPSTETANRYNYNEQL